MKTFKQMTFDLQCIDTTDHRDGTLPLSRLLYHVVYQVLVSVIPNHHSKCKLLCSPSPVVPDEALQFLVLQGTTILFIRRHVAVLGINTSVHTKSTQKMPKFFSRHFSVQVFNTFHWKVCRHLQDLGKHSPARP